MKIIGAVDIGGTKIAVGAASEDGKIIFRVGCPTHPELGFAAAMDRIKSLLHKAAAHTGGDFEGIGIACPGPLDPTTGVIGIVGTLAGWEGGNLISTLESEFRVHIAVENDADAATLAVATCGAGKGSSHLIYVTVSSGIGAGILLDGHLYRGFRGAHPELGHHDRRCLFRFTLLLQGERLLGESRQRRGHRDLDAGATARPDPANGSGDMPPR